MKLSLVIPCYNEELGLPRLIARCREVVDFLDCEIILVDNGSKDNSASVLSALTAGHDRLRVESVKTNQGYGFGILSGLRTAKGQIIGFTHADMQTDPMDVVEGMKLFRAAADPERLFVKGTRYGRPLSDRFFTTGMSIFETLLIGHIIRDVNAQPTLFARSFFETWIDPPHDFSLDLFAYATAKKRGLSVARFPVNFAPREIGVSSWNVNWSGKYKFIRRTLDYSFALRRRLKNL